MTTVDPRSEASAGRGIRTPTQASAAPTDPTTIDARTIDARTIDARTIDTRTIDARTIDLRGADPGPLAAPAATSREMDDTDAHLLRLCLDLQLDALLLTVGAAAAQESRQAPDGPDQVLPAGVPPWRRWVEEDVDLATTLAADAMTGHAALPSTLGTELDHGAPSTVVADLTARYESMSDLLGDLLGRDPGPGDEQWRLRVREALRRCRSRLAELRDYQLTGTPPRGLRRGEPAMAAMTAAGSPLAPEHRYLPGELLG